jgi:bifunctional non-homologous end joining protein LigD
MVLRFIPPASPRRRDRPPVGDRWIHEVKFDGYRIQVHKAGRDVELLSRNGHGFNERFPDIAFLLRTLPAKAAIIDAELVACSSASTPRGGALAHPHPLAPGRG